MKALIIVDPQNDFCPGGALAVPGGDEIIRPINERAAQVVAEGGVVIITQDWHPADHASFASQHGQSPFTTTELSYGELVLEQVLWPDHCVQGTRGADFHQDLDTRLASAIIRKGMNRSVDSYSAFYENDNLTPTGLKGYLHTLKVTDVVVVGLAYDYCVGYTALDAVRCGFKVTVVKSLTRAIAENTSRDMETKFERFGINVEDGNAT